MTAPLKRRALLPLALAPLLARGNTPEPAKGDLIRWPEVALLDGGRLAAPAPGGEASVVVFFSTTCPFCVRHNAHVQKLHDALRGQPLRVLGVAHDKQEAWVRRYVAQRGLTFPVSMDQAVLHAALSRLPGTPVTVVVDRQQRLREVIRGEMFEEDVLELAKYTRAGSGA